MSKTRDSSGVFILLILSLLLFFCAALFVHPFTYARWDNFEYFIPTLTEAHGQWLRGILPLWNTHQHMGEPLLANSQPGVFYIPYTLAVCAALRSPWGPVAIPMLVVAAHAAFASVGFFLLFRQLGIRFWLAAACALAATFSGFVTLLSTIWLFMGIYFAWFPWIVRGALAAIRNGPVSQKVWLAVGLAACGTVGYPQLLIYLWLWVGLFSVILGWGNAAALRRVAALALSAGLLSLPSLLPVLRVSSYSLRGDLLTAGQFLERGISFQDLWSLFSPLLNLPNIYLRHHGSMTLYIGAWLLPVLGFAIARAPKKGEGEPVLRALLAPTLLFLLFALGTQGGVYGWTRFIPVWGSLRWPFKFLLFANAGLAVAGALAVERWIQVGMSAFQRKALCATALAWGLLLTFYRSPEPTQGAGILLNVAAISAFAALFVMHRRSGPILFVASVLLSAIGTLAMAHQAGLKTYTEAYGIFDARYFGIDPNYRVLPATPPPNFSKGRQVMQPLGLYQSATANRYDSLTGLTTPLEPRWFLEHIPSTDSGALPVDVGILRSHFLKALNVRYVIVGTEDEPHLQIMKAAGNFHAMTRLPDAVVFEQDQALPRAYFADHLWPMEGGRFPAALIQNSVSLRSAFIDAPVEENLPPASVLSIEEGAHDVHVRVEAPRGGFLVYSTTFYPDWSATVDGVSVAVQRTNGLLLGIRVPAGASKVHFSYWPRGLKEGLGLAILGLLLLLAQCLPNPLIRRAFKSHKR